ncbi:hypothetical protein T4D_6113 [Trichinella pseudospiralis]|uniref:Uncharacterized protein n=1 Tax=Trichinella pseudospiralis TaxID=6337 RepID=A0A0V1G1X2_TRIPS|nr:hypothetical protein T4D_6113 [Trichinella pseudospiralis]
MVACALLRKSKPPNDSALVILFALIFHFTCSQLLSIIIALKICMHGAYHTLQGYQILSVHIRDCALSNKGTG